MEIFHKKHSQLLFGIIFLALPLVLQADTLPEAISEAIKTNPEVLSAEYNRLALDRVVTEARAAYLPTLQTSASYGPTGGENINTDFEMKTYEATTFNLTATQMIFDGFATPSEVRRNKARVDSAAYQLLAKIEDIAYEGAQAYLSVLRERELVALAEDNLKQHQHLGEMVRLRVKNGLSTQADSVQIQGRLALAESNLLAEISNQQDAVARYQHVLGAFPRYTQLPPHVDPSLLPKTQQAGVDYALSHHPTILSAQADIEAARSQYRAAKADFFPRLDLEAIYERDRNIGGVKGPSYGQSVVAKISYDIFSGGSHIARTRETSLLLRQAQEILRNAQRQAAEDARFSWDALMAARSLLPLLEEHKTATANTIESYKKQFTVGKRNLLDLLDVQNEAFSARRAAIDGQYKILLSEYQLLHAMGSLSKALKLTLPKEVRPL